MHVHQLFKDQIALGFNFVIEKSLAKNVQCAIGSIIVNVQRIENWTRNELESIGLRTLILRYSNIAGASSWLSKMCDVKIHGNDYENGQKQANSTTLHCNQIVPFQWETAACATAPDRTRDTTSRPRRRTTARWRARATGTGSRTKPAKKRAVKSGEDRLVMKGCNMKETTSWQCFLDLKFWIFLFLLDTTRQRRLPISNRCLLSFDEKQSNWH